MPNSFQNCKIFNHLEFSAKRESSSIFILTITVATILINKIKKYTLDIYKNKISTKGFSIGNVPDHYVESNCCTGINESCTKFILKYFVLDFIEKKLVEQKMVCLAGPNLVNIKCLENGNISYIFKISVVSNISPDNWEKISFTPPKRKLYKDLDRQAVLFIKSALDETLEQPLKSQESNNTSSDKSIVQSSDWVLFSTVLLNNNNQPAIRDYKNSFWLKIDTRYITTPLHKTFLGKQEMDSFIVEDLPIFGTPSDLLSIKGKFKVTINSIVKTTQFSLNKFKTIFSLSDNKDVHEKLIEIFSFRNDISQRRLIIDEAFRVLFAKIRFEVPRYLVLRRQEKLLDNIKKLPDYNVYKMNENFDRQICILAEKQIKEEALIRQIGYNEGITVSNDDVFEYLNLLNHSRLIEFIYFLPNFEYVQDVCLPLKESILKAAVLKEKVLNFVIKRLSLQ